MFKTARMRKIRIVTLDEYISPTVSALHEQGLVQINEISDSIQQDPELAELVTPSKASAFTGKLSSLLMKTSAISELLGNSLSEGHGIKDTIKSFISPEMPIQKEVGDLDTEALINKAEDLLAQVESETKVIEGKFSALDSETSVLTSNKSLAKRLYNLDMDLALLKDSKYTSITVGRINAESASEIESNLSKLTDELDVFIVPNDDKETANIIVVTLKEFGEDVYSTLRKFDFERVEVSNVKGTPQQIISSADSRLVTIESERNSAKSDLKAKVNRLGATGGTWYSRPLAMTTKEITKLTEERPDNRNIVIFVSDGEPAEVDKTIKDEADKLKAVPNTTVYTVGFDADIEILKQIATDDGKYRTTDQASSLNTIFNEIVDEIAIKTEKKQSVSGKIELSNVDLNKTNKVVIKVNGTAISADKVQAAIVTENSKYYIDLNKLNLSSLRDDVLIEYFINE